MWEGSFSMLSIFSRRKVFYSCRWDQMLLPFPSVFPFTLNCIAPDKNFRFDLAIHFFLCICFVNFRFNTISIFLASFFLAVGLVLFCFYWCGSCLRVQMCNKAKITEILFSVNRRGNLREKVCNLCEHKKRIPFIFTLFLCSAPIHFERSQKRCYFVWCSLCNAI